MLSALLIHGVPIECINQAAVQYFVPAKVIIAVLQTEGGRPGLASPNRNGTVDYGPMQINSAWIKQIAPYGYTDHQVQDDPCTNVKEGAWILSQAMAHSSAQPYWQGVSNYHSYTPVYNQTYQRQIKSRYVVLTRALGEAV